LTFDGRFHFFWGQFLHTTIVQYQEKYGGKFCFHDSASLLLPCLPAANKQQSEIHAILGHASITTMMASVPIPTIYSDTDTTINDAP
jgi:hypothetical protein